MPHIHDKIDFTVGALIVYRRRVLLRVHDKYGKWLLPGGHIELEEDPNEAVVREAKEEVGLSISLVGGTWRALQHVGSRMEPCPGELVSPRFMNRHHIGENGHEHIDLVFVATCDSADVQPSGDDRSDGWKWFSREDLEDPQYKLDPRIKYYAMTALNEVSG